MTWVSLCIALYIEIAALLVANAGLYKPLKYYHSMMVVLLRKSQLNYPIFQLLILASSHINYYSRLLRLQGHVQLISWSP